MGDCKICSGNFADSPDELILCEHKGGLVHLGCCVSLCSGDGKPCQHSKAIYSKLIK
ncbi:MAG: hypothetical protein KAK00_07750 [Nanoarchaeota archaeon]|nr:hypothetical protein [Nanoarchaeota archaeon]